ncbi:hypothetical protein BGY98DRAFT_1012785 [Russula aff. rugulosa BPL654]|nr:hypothetical protein BGY98DRAFT_1012785 [Russula aff. rugulosa BPL654]
MLQPSLSGNVCISVICTLNLNFNINTIAELMSMLLFVQQWNLVKQKSVLMSSWISYQLIAIKRH